MKLAKVLYESDSYSSPSDSPLLAWIERHYPDRSLDWWHYLCLSFPDGLPASVTAKFLWEVCPWKIRDQVTLYFQKSASRRPQ